MEGGARAVFLDRDGTLIVDQHYLSDPEGVRLLPGAVGAVARFNRAGLRTVLVTNQSGIGRGYFTEAQYRLVHARLVEVLAAEGARLDAAYFSAAVEDGEDPDCDRKPGAGMYLRAAADHGIDLAASFYVGDRVRDVVAARRFGGRGFLVAGEKTEAEEAAALGISILPSLTDIADEILGRESESA